MECSGPGFGLSPSCCIWRMNSGCLHVKWRTPSLKRGVCSSRLLPVQVSLSRDMWLSSLSSACAPAPTQRCFMSHHSQGWGGNLALLARPCHGTCCCAVSERPLVCPKFGTVLPTRVFLVLQHRTIIVLRIYKVFPSRTGKLLKADGECVTEPLGKE